jgi:hypothetical protein
MINQGHQGRGLTNNTQPNPARHLSDLVSQELRRVPRGAPLPGLKEFISPYLVTDPIVEQFLKIHHADLTLPARPRHSVLTEGQFTDFLRHEAQELEDRYLEYKSKGFTGCYDVSADATARLNRVAVGCAEAILTARGEHQYTGVAIDTRYYIVDFTVDQFLAYPEIVRRTRTYVAHEIQQDTSKPSYAGVLILPCYRFPA